MILHTIIPIDQVMQLPENVEYEYKEMNKSYIQGVNLNGKFTVSRLISTNPKLYLDPRYAPGEMLSEK